MYLGAVGAYDWSGTVVKYDRSGDTTADISTFEEVKTVLANRTKLSYLGYAITSGFYNGGRNEWVAVGAPKNQLYGAVVVYRPLEDNTGFNDAETIYPRGDARQLGSYFGGVLLSTDVNGDGSDDLFVGAPLFIGDNYDDGRVFAYISSTSQRNPAIWAGENYTPTLLSGTIEDQGGRFGTAMAAAGDLNNDNFNDIIIGSPYSNENKGAVFVFHGSANGIDPVPKQVIRAMDITSSNLQYFGLSLAGGEDLDGNGYPDIAVGAPKSDAVVVFRSRPVARFTGSLEFTRKQIRIFECLEQGNRNCVALEACLTVNGNEIEETIPVQIRIGLDTLVSGRDNKRVEYRTENAAATDVISETKVLMRNIESCWRYEIFVKRSIADYSTPIVASMTYEMSDAHLREPLSSVRDPSIPNTFNTTTEFSRNCGEDNKCEYNLVMGGNASLPLTRLSGNGNDGIFLVVSEQTASNPLRFRATLRNTGEDAFDVRVSVFYNNLLTFQSLGNFESSNSDSSYPCMVDSNQDQFMQPYNRKLLTYEYSRDRGSIMRRNEFCTFEFNISSSDLRTSGVLPALNVTVFAHTLQNTIDDDEHPDDNTWVNTAPLRYSADVSLIGPQTPTVIPFNFTSENQSIVSVRQIGQNTSDIHMHFQVSGSGHSTIPSSSLNLSFPYTLPNDEGGNFHILYPISASCISETGRASCECDNSVINPYNLSLQRPPLNRRDAVGLPSVVVAPHPMRINSSITYNCSNPSTVALGICETFRCNIFNLTANEAVNVRVVFRLWSQSFNLVYNDTVIRFGSKFSYTTEDSNLIINKQEKPVITRDATVLTTARLFVPGTVLGSGNPIWIFIVAAIGGLLLLILIIIILWKTGFFKSKYAEKKEALAWTEANTSE